MARACRRTRCVHRVLPSTWWTPRKRKRLILTETPMRPSATDPGESLSIPARPENAMPQRGDGRSRGSLRLGLDAGVASALQAKLMLQPPVLPIRVGGRDGNLGRNPTEIGGDAEKRDVAGVAGEVAMRVTVRQHEILHGKLDIDHAAWLLF